MIKALPAWDDHMCPNIMAVVLILYYQDVKSSIRNILDNDVNQPPSKVQDQLF